MTRKILINGRREEELRVAIVENQTLEDFEIETKHSGQLRNNIYRGVVANIAPSLNAAFIDFGDTRNGFLAFNDVVESAYCKRVKDANRISDVLTVGQTLIVQVIKDATTLKGAQVTTNISLAGRYLVLRPKDAKSGVSRKVDDDARADLTQKVRSLDLPEGYGCIVRTNAMDQSRAILLRDAKVLVQLWHKIEAEFSRGTAPQMLYNDQDIVVQAMRDYFDSSIQEVLIDDKSCFERAKTYIKATVASGEEKIKLYEDRLPLFTRYGIEKQIEQIYARTVRLPSGGFIVIDPTEALTAIDVNSAHSTKRETQDLTAYHTNLEAAAEIGRQLRMRDIGGLIVIDFIDMRQGKHQRDVERAMRTAMARDKARNKVERISANGLLEINRQRISQALTMRTHLECPTCGGRGFIPSAEAIGMSLIREIDARSVSGELGGVIIKLNPDIAQQLQNERRREFAQLENEYGIHIEIVGSRDVSLGDESIEWLTKRQENELHPERVAAQPLEAASIIDVAEAYQNESNGEDEGYRPNDFEEFSSDEARRKRAAKRAARRDQIAEVKSEGSVSSVSGDESEKSERPVRAAKSMKPVKVEKDKAERSSMKSEPEEKLQTGSHNATGLAILGVLVEQMRGRMEDELREGGRSRRRSNFRSRRRGRSENSGVQSDFRLFVMDILKSVCLVGCGCNTDITRQEMISRMHEVSDWLLETSIMSSEDRNRRVIAFRNQVASRHATARLNCLFDGVSSSRPDELTRILIDERDAVFGQSEAVNDALIKQLSTHFESRCSQIFGQPSAPMAFDTSDIESVLEDLDGELDDAFEGFDASPDESLYVTPAMSAPAAEVSKETSTQASSREVISGRRRSRSRRRAIEESFVSPYAGENQEVVVADVPIASMHFVDEDNARESEATPELAQAITQELPAVMPLRRQRRRNRSDIRPRENAVNEEVPTVSDRVLDEKLPEDDKNDEVKAVEVSKERVPETRRVRHTRRMGIASEGVDSSVENVVKKSVVAEVSEPIEVKKTENLGEFVMVDSPMTTSEGSFSLVENASRDEARSRRHRRTDRVRIGDVQAEGQVVEVPSERAIFNAGNGELVEVANEETPKTVETPDPLESVVEVVAAQAASERGHRTERAPRKTRKAREAEAAREAVVAMETPKAVEVPAVPEVSTTSEASVVDAPKDGEKSTKSQRSRASKSTMKLDAEQLLNGDAENRSTRRVRKTHPAKSEKAGVVEATVKTEPVVETEVVKAAEDVAPEASVSNVPEEKKERRPRRTRRTQSVEETPQPEVVAESAVETSIPETPGSETRPRTRKTRRTRPDVE